MVHRATYPKELTYTAIANIFTGLDRHLQAFTFFRILSHSFAFFRIPSHASTKALGKFAQTYTGAI